MPCDGFRSIQRKLLTGFSAEEIEMIRKLQTDCEYEELKGYVLGVLDRRNNGLGTTWFSGNGVYGAHFYESPDRVILIVGTSSD